MAIDPLYPATIYAGTKGDAVYKSYDGGQRWTSLRVGLDDATISSVVNQCVFDPADAQHLFLATTMGVFETKNAGERWVKRMEGMKEVLMVVTLGMDPTRSAVLYAGTSGGVYKSTNQGAHWQQVNEGLVPADMVKTSRALSVTSVQVDPSAPETVYAAPNGAGTAHESGADGAYAVPALSLHGELHAKEVRIAVLETEVRMERDARVRAERRVDQEGNRSLALAQQLGEYKQRLAMLEAPKEEAAAAPEPTPEPEPTASADDVKPRASLLRRLFGGNRHVGVG